MLKNIFSYIEWPQKYDGTSLKMDILAGLTVALVLIPQSMAYAELAGLPPYYGLYASFLPPLIAAVFGSSRQLATGPVAVVSLLTATILEPLATAGSQQYISYAILLALLVGAFQFSLGVLKLGLVVNFISHPVVNGFTNAAALIIATSQLPKLFGIHIDKAPHHYEMIYGVIKAAGHYMHWPTLFMGVLAFVIMYALKRITPRLPNVLAAVVITTILSWSLEFEHNVVVDVSTVHSEQVKQTIEKFNHTIGSITGMTGKRAELIQKLNVNRAAPDSHAKLDTRHAAERMALQIEQHKEDASDYRKQIRSFLFEAVRGKDGALVFYPINEIADRNSVDGRVWRFKVGNTPLQTDRLQMIGGGEVVGNIPRGLPSLSWPRIDYHVVLHLIPFVAIIALLGFMEAISVAKAMAAKTGQRLDPNRELIGQGLANICGAVAKSYPTSGSFSRSAVNLQSGAVSGLSGVITSLSVVVVLLFFTPLFGFLIDRKGRSATAMIYGSLTLLIVHLIFGLTDIMPYIPMILLGIAFSLVPASMWPSMVKLVPEKQIGTAYGLMYSIQNLGLWAFPLLAGFILDKTNPGNPEVADYSTTILMFSVLGVLGLLFAVLLKRADKKYGFGIELPMNKK